MVDQRPPRTAGPSVPAAAVGPAVDIGANIRGRRRALGLSARGLAAQVGIAHSSLRQIEIGVSRPRPELLDRLCEALGTTPLELGRNAVQDADPFASLSAFERAALLEYLAFLRWQQERSRST